MNPPVTGIDGVAAVRNVRVLELEPVELDQDNDLLRGARLGHFGDVPDGQIFAEGCLLAVNLGNDADTTGAIYGQIAGAYYGAGAIPRSWEKTVVRGDLIIEMAEKLMRQ
jgi:hypothetical protein